MHVNADFSRPVIVTPEDYLWVASRQEGVDRVMLDRLGAESGRATSIVRYAPGSRFPGHAHPGGEEELVVSGTFADEEAQYPAGWYLRNPPGSSHRPVAPDGAEIFVKLWQMPAGEKRRVRIDTREPSAWQQVGVRAICPLFTSAEEQVSLQRLVAGERLPVAPPRGAEVLVLAGSVQVDDRRCDQGSWIRLPPGPHPDIVARAQGATLYLKTGHLAALGTAE